MIDSMIDTIFVTLAPANRSSRRHKTKNHTKIRIFFETTTISPTPFHHRLAVCSRMRIFVKPTVGKYYKNKLYVC